MLCSTVAWWPGLGLVYVAWYLTVILACCVSRALLISSGKPQDACRSTASHPEVRRTLSLKKKSLTMCTNKASEGGHVGCSHTSSLSCHTHTGLKDTTLCDPLVRLTVKWTHRRIHMVFSVNTKVREQQQGQTWESVGKFMWTCGHTWGQTCICGLAGLRM